MISRRTYPAKTLILAVAIAVVRGAKPLIGIAEEVEKKWEELKRKFKMKAKDRYQHRITERRSSTTDLTKADNEDRLKYRRASDWGSTLDKFKSMDRASRESSVDDVFSREWKPPKFDKNDPDYGRPKKGSLTEKRGIAAGHHVGKEIITLCEVITEYGDEYEDGTCMITFGKLFDVYRFISDKVVGMLLRARKHKLLIFEGEMLYQRRDEEVPIILLKSLKEVRALYAQSDDPAHCLTQS